MKTGMTSKRLIGAAALACAACCAVPLVSLLGLGGTIGAAGAFFADVEAETVFCLAIVGSVLRASLYYGIRKRQAKPNCKTACSSSASCCGQKPSP